MIRPICPPSPKDRFDVYRFFSGIAAGESESESQLPSRAPRVKTFLLEHVSCRGECNPRPPQQILTDLGASVRPLDDTFMEVRIEVTGDAGRRRIAPVGYLEQYDERFFAYYTAERAPTAQKLVRRWVALSPDLDRTWFSGPFLQHLWDRNVSLRGDDRVGKLVFRHDSIFDMPEDAALAPDEDAEDDNTEQPEDPGEAPKQPFYRRKTRSEIRDGIGPIKRVLGQLQGAYNPFNALYALRLPSRIRRGGHDLNQAGQITNLSDSFEEHRNVVRSLYRTYKAVLESTEKVAWLNSEKDETTRTSRQVFKGVPLIIHFAEVLSPAVFDRWVSLAFQKRNQFRLWGDPIRLGPTKIHVYGADRHLWQPINLEITARRLVAILPRGTCGNTFHRLVANVQRYVCPKITAWLGSKPFHELISETEVSPEETA